MRIPCDRDAVLESVSSSVNVIQTLHTTTQTFQSFKSKMVQDVIFERSFQSVSLSARKHLRRLHHYAKIQLLTATTCLTLHYVHAMVTGLAQKLDLVFVFRPSRP